MQKNVVIEKNVGQTPLECMEIWRDEQKLSKEIPLAYAGRLDPMASGKLLVLIGEECKRQTDYHSLDKTYEFEVIFGLGSDSGDVLGIVSECNAERTTEAQLSKIASKLTGTVTFPYPKFSSKTVQGKPLHTWTLEGRLSEIEIPTYQSTVYKLKLIELRTVSTSEIIKTALEKVESIPKVTDERKAIGNDFRRPDVRKSWQTFIEHTPKKELQIAKFSCSCSSGTYMRTLAEEIAKRTGACGMAFSIHRTCIGKYQPLPLGFGFWLKKF